MTSRAMIVVGAGSSTRFGGDKLLTPVAGAPLVAHPVNTIRAMVDRCVLVHRADQQRRIASLRLEVDLVPGGATRTRSEGAGLAALDDAYDLIGIHDAARPLVSADLITTLFEAAESHGGAIPVIEPDGLILERSTLRPIENVAAAQTPQVFRSAVLREAYEMAAESDYEGHDTAEVVQHFTDCQIVCVPGQTTNLKVTYREDLDLMERLLTGSTRTEPR